MLGAIIGDTVGSRFEFNNIKTKDFELITKESELTDDSIMTLAVYDILKNHLYERDQIIDTFKRWGRSYPNRGYGGRFAQWLFSSSRESYRSYGNGAAMRVSPVGWLARSEEEVKNLSRMVTEVTHSHPEGIKGAEVTAMCVYYARLGKSKEFIKDYVSKYYSLDFDYEDLKKNFDFDETCQNTVPQAIFCFLISTSFEDCLRTTISIGGDCDTTAAISCAIAEAYYKDIDPELIHQVMKKLPKDVNECKPRKLFEKQLSYRTFENVFSEEIDQSTRVCIFEFLDDDNKYYSPMYSKRVGAIKSYICYDIVDQMFGIPDEELAPSCLETRYLEDYFKVILEISDEIEIPWKCKDIFLAMEKVKSFEELKVELNRLNEILKDTSFKYQIKLFDNPDQAITYLNSEIDLGLIDYKKIFNNEYCAKVV